MAAVLTERTRQYSDASNSHFVNLIEYIGRALEPTPTQLSALERSYDSTSAFLVECPEFEGELLEVHPQGSRELGTLIRPLRGGDGFDVDLVARFDRKAHARYSSQGPVELVDRLYKAVKRYADQHGLTLKKWDRCVTLEYADGMCADIAPVIDSPVHHALYGDTHGLIPDRDRRTFDPTNPKGLARYFNGIAAIQPVFSRTIIAKAATEDLKRADVTPLSNAEDVFDRLLCRIIQLIKLHRDTTFAKSPDLIDQRPTSIFLTALAAGAYARQAPLEHADPLDLFIDIVRDMPDFIGRNRSGAREEWQVQNPTAPGDNLASAMNLGSRQDIFDQWYRKFAKDIVAIVDAIELRSGMDQVGKLVTGAFGERAGKALINGQLNAQDKQRSAGAAKAVLAGGLILPLTATANTFYGK
jgi:hypothetical protein